MAIEIVSKTDAQMRRLFNFAKSAEFQFFIKKLGQRILNGSFLK
jgi:hypothetical protein